MEYLTGIHALNMPCRLDTCGDWHQSALRWENLTIRQSENMFFRDWGIEEPKNLPCCKKRMPVADHIRALLDLLEESNFPQAQGMNKDFISNSKYDRLVFKKVWQMKELPNWDAINDFMGKEYLFKWEMYKKEVI